jgi:hypothetical protein
MGEGELNIRFIAHDRLFCVGWNYLCRFGKNGKINYFL